MEKRNIVFCAKGIVVVLLFIIAAITSVFSQPSGISVQPGDFYRDEADLTARMHPVRNDNAQNCALLKIVTTEKDFVFEPDALGMCRDVEYKTAEVWLWLAPGSRRLTIKHPQLGQLRNYEYPLAIEPSTVYVMKLTTGKVTTIVQQVNQENFLVLAVTPPEAAVKVDGKMVVTKKGIYQGMYSVGKHHYEAFCDLYHPQQGEFIIAPDETTDLKLTLKPNYGWINVVSQPESDAAVYIDGRQVGTTPYKSNKLASGSYTVQVAKDMWQESAREVTVADEKTTTVTLTMNPDFAEPQIVCDDADAEIWVNGEKKGIGRWTGRLAAGAYKIEARRASHRSTSQSVTLHNGDRQTMTIEAPQPIYGKLIVTTEPVGADILLDGKNVGTTPKIVNNVLVGNYELVLQKQGFTTTKKKISITEGETIEVNETLPEVVNQTQGFQCGGKMKDYDGNEYNTVKIGGQCWMAENMRTTKYSDGSSIIIAYWYYPNNNASNKATYGLLYNWKAVMNSFLANTSGVQGICPTGWHVPSDAEWTQLTDYVSGQSQSLCDNYSANIAKALAATKGWSNSSYTCAVGNNQYNNNALGFSAAPAGRYNNIFYDFGSDAYFWSATENGSDNVCYRTLSYNSAYVSRNYARKNNCFSVRCLRDK